VRTSQLTPYLSAQIYDVITGYNTTVYVTVYKQPNAGYTAHSYIMMLKNLFSLFGLSLSASDTETKKSLISGKTGKGWRLEALIRENWPNVKIVRLPNISKFSIDLGRFNPLMLLNGIMLREPPSLFFESHRNGKMNRYLIYMTWKLCQLSQTNKKLYWKYAFYYVTNSNAYLLACL
jgi:hypothetical protein